MQRAADAVAKAAGVLGLGVRVFVVTSKIRTRAAARVLCMWFHAVQGAVGVDPKSLEK